MKRPPWWHRIVRRRVRRLALELPAIYKRKGHAVANHILFNDEIMVITIKGEDDQGRFAALDPGDVFTINCSDTTSVNATIGKDANNAPSVNINGLVDGPVTGVSVTVTDSEDPPNTSPAYLIDLMPRPPGPVTSLILDFATATTLTQPVPIAPAQPPDQQSASSRAPGAKPAAKD